jgi:hypothetical protein
MKDSDYTVDDDPLASLFGEVADDDAASKAIDRLIHLLSAEDLFDSDVDGAV